MEIVVAIMVWVGSLTIWAQKSHESHEERMAKAGMCQEVQDHKVVWQPCKK